MLLELRGICEGVEVRLQVPVAIFGDRVMPVSFTSDLEFRVHDAVIKDGDDAYLLTEMPEAVVIGENLFEGEVIL